MPSNPQYPGVYVQEAPRGVRNIAGVPTSVTAFIGTIPSGALYQPAHLASFVDFERVFGTPTTGCEIGYSVHQFFLNGGSDAWVVRIPDHPTEAQWLEGIRALDSVDMFSLLKAALRQRPNEIIIGEIRGVNCRSNRRRKILNGSLIDKSPT